MLIIRRRECRLLDHESKKYTFARWYPQAQISEDFPVSPSRVLEAHMVQLHIPFHRV
jgi:hypothetical protein